MLSAIGGGALEVAGFELVYVTAPGDGVRVGLADAWALRLESVPPVRRFASYRGQRHLSGCWWSATDGRHVGFESWLERDHVMALDFDPAVGITDAADGQADDHALPLRSQPRRGDGRAHGGDAVGGTGVQSSSRRCSGAPAPTAHRWWARRSSPTPAPRTPSWTGTWSGTSTGRTWCHTCRRASPMRSSTSDARDVPDACAVVPEAWELVERGHVAVD